MVKIDHFPSLVESGTILSASSNALHLIHDLKTLQTATGGTSPFKKLVLTMIPVNRKTYIADRQHDFALI